MTGNDFIAWVLRSPFHGILSNGMMLITVTGRRTGKKYTIPIEYYEQDGSLWVVTSRDRKWWRNVRNGAEVGLLLKRKPVSAFAEAILDEAEIEAQLLKYIQRMPVSARALGLRVENNLPNVEDIKRAAKDRLFVRLAIR